MPGITIFFSAYIKFTWSSCEITWNWVQSRQIILLSQVAATIMHLPTKMQDSYQSSDSGSFSGTPKISLEFATYRFLNHRSQVRTIRNQRLLTINLFSSFTHYFPSFALCAPLLENAFTFDRRALSNHSIRIIQMQLASRNTFKGFKSWCLRIVTFIVEAHHAWRADD